VFKFSGNPQQLLRLQKRLQEVAGEALPEISEQLAEESLNLTREGFDKGRDPYGRRWKARKGRATGRALLVRSGLMRGSVFVKSEARQFTVGFARGYATFLQRGTSKMVMRMLVPTATRGLPARWAREYEDVALDVFEELLGG
jgi:phage gpG-like protein